MPSLVSGGTIASSANNVANPTVLNPTLATPRTTGERLFLFSSSPSASATVSVTSGWQTLWNIGTSAGRIAGFTAPVTGSETAPTVTWTGLTTGASGTPCTAYILNLGSGFLETGGLATIDAMSLETVFSDADAQPGGAAFYTVGPDTWILSHGVRVDNEALSGTSNAGGSPIAFTSMATYAEGSGAGMVNFTAMGLGPVPVGGLIMEHSWSLTGGVLVDGVGVMVALATVSLPGEPGALAYTRGRAPG